MLTRGQLAAKAKVSIETVRYYERRGLLPEPARTEAGYRQYSPTEVERLQFIKTAQALGFSLKEIEDLLSFCAESKTACVRMRKRIQEKIREVQKRISLLQGLVHTLEEFDQRCAEKKTSQGCPLIQCFGEGEI